MKWPFTKRKNTWMTAILHINECIVNSNIGFRWIWMKRNKDRIIIPAEIRLEDVWFVIGYSGCRFISNSCRWLRIRSHCSELWCDYCISHIGWCLRYFRGKSCIDWYDRFAIASEHIRKTDHKLKHHVRWQRSTTAFWTLYIWISKQWPTIMNRLLKRGNYSGW